MSELRPLSCRAVARVLGVSPKTLRIWREEGSGPPYFEIDAPVSKKKMVRYPAAEFESWYKARFFHSAQAVIEADREAARKEAADA